MGHTKKSKTIKMEVTSRGVNDVIIKPSSTCDRVLRSRRSVITSRRLHGFVGRTPKRLFTPEIKKQLKQWLVRRRRYPYPTRDEKRRLAQETGLDYSQICNWFANWRRKLKNAECEQGDELGDEDFEQEVRGSLSTSSWGRRILRYNHVAARNAEKIPICSEDSMIDNEGDEEVGVTSSEDEEQYFTSDEDSRITVDPTIMDHCYSLLPPPSSSTPDRNGNYVVDQKLSHSKWLASVESFTPQQQRQPIATCATRLFVSWAAAASSGNPPAHDRDNEERRARDEMDAAEALTTLARASRAK